VTCAEDLHKLHQANKDNAQRKVLDFHVVQAFLVVLLKASFGPLDAVPTEGLRIKHDEVSEQHVQLLTLPEWHALHAHFELKRNWIRVKMEESVLELLDNLEYSDVVDHGEVIQPLDPLVEIFKDSRPVGHVVKLILRSFPVCHLREGP
jgi:hypothetical protein